MEWLTRFKHGIETYWGIRSIAISFFRRIGVRSMVNFSFGFSALNVLEVKGFFSPPLFFWREQNLDFAPWFVSIKGDISPVVVVYFWFFFHLLIPIFLWFLCVCYI